MSSATQILPRYTYQDWLNWEGQWELIYGIPYAMSPAPILKHQWIANNLGSEFRIAMKGCGNKCKVYQTVDYKIREDTIVQPDVVVACRQKEAKQLQGTPTIVAEILSPSTALKDRHTKFDIYKFQKVPYYLIVDCDVETVEVYQLVNDEYQLKDKGRDNPFTFQLEDCTASINFKEIWD